MDSLAALALGSGVSFGQAIFGVFALFCRIGGCIMVAPGFSSMQIPLQSRLWIALGVSLALAPICLNLQIVGSWQENPVQFAQVIVTESLIGLMIGFLARMFFLALETFASMLATMLGLANPFGISIDAGEVMPPIASLIVLSATALMFAMGLHVELLRGLAASYKVMPLGGPFDVASALRRLATVTADAFIVALRVCSPFVIYSVLVNVGVSLVNKMTPQIAIYLIAMPFTIAGGVLLLYFSVKPLLIGFLAAFAQLLRLG